jgi:phosphoenolpyruvate---glycerone phosphotransferase subunit DhaL
VVRARPYAGATLGVLVASSEQTKRFIRRFAALIDEHAAELTELDSAIGDADHGINMRRGTQAALERIETLDGAAPADVLKATAMALISKVGGASGPLYGTAFLRAADAAAGKEKLEPRDVAAVFAAMLAGVRDRGHANVGEKTMVDALEPATQTLGEAVDRGDSLLAALQAAHAAAQVGSDSTIPMIAQKGRASYLGERSRGHRDPGSASTVLLFEAAAQSLADG